MSVQTEMTVPIGTVKKSVHVKRSAEDAFRIFVDEMGAWWPNKDGKYTYGGDRAQDVVLEARVGGRFYERYKDGEEFVIGHVVACDRPRRILFTWGAVGEVTTEVEVTFVAEGNGTRVDLEHRGIEKMGAMAHGFDQGWDDVLAQFVRRTGS
jgi:uncharacterized protein YndB with AHSA1/START domain